MSSPQKPRAKLHPLTPIRDAAALSSVEYAIILVIVAAIAVGAWKTFGENVDGSVESTTESRDGDVRHAPAKPAP